MSHYILVDAPGIFVDQLSEKLGGTNELIDSQTYQDVEALAVDLRRKITPETRLLINAEAVFSETQQQSHEILALLFWIRCKFNLKNPICVYSGQGLATILQKNPEFLIIASPGSNFIRLPFTPGKIELLTAAKPLEYQSLLKPFLKAKVDTIIPNIRHKLANYIAMALMLNIAKEVFDIEDDFEILDPSHEDFYELRDDLSISILATYFDFSYQKTIQSENKNDFKIHSTNRVVLIDDLVEQGWGKILGQMLYGDINAKEMAWLDIKDLSKSIFDLKTPSSFKIVDEIIKRHKPHLILLDLRLKEESGKVNLSDLDGFKILNYLRNHDVYAGIPIIMFTATTNVETIRNLLKAGANYVWTKPGIDEDLKPKEIGSRYLDLIHMTRSIFNEADTSGLAVFNTNSSTISKLSFEELRDQLLSKANYVKYRSKLLGLVNLHHEFSQYTDIFIDTNALMTGIIHNSSNNVDFARTILNIFLLCQISNHTQHKMMVDGKMVTVKVPKVITTNFVLDEIMELSKMIKPDEIYKAKRALLGYGLIRTAIESNKVRTEFTEIDPNDNFKWEMKKIACPHYADNQIINEILRIVSGKGFKLPREEKHETTSYATVSYATPARNVLLISHENPKKMKYDKYGKLQDNLPRDLMKAFLDLPNPKGKLTINRLNAFNGRMKNITL